LAAPHWTNDYYPEYIKSSKNIYTKNNPINNGHLSRQFSKEVIQMANKYI
jgi:hypothetical protein